MLLSFALTPTLAYDFKVDGIYYNVLSESDRTCKVTNYFRDYSGKITIPEKVTYNTTTYSVTEIGSYAFWDCSGLTSVSIGNSVTTIGNTAFYGCSGLETFTIADGSSELNFNSFAFNHCPLKNVYLGRNITYNSYDSPFYEKNGINKSDYR